MHEAVADEFFPLYKARCAEDGVVTKGDAAAVKALGCEPCTDWAVEYSDKIISVKVCPCVSFSACMQACMYACRHVCRKAGRHACPLPVCAIHLSSFPVCVCVRCARTCCVVLCACMRACTHA